jgi:hypothetical protein
MLSAQVALLNVDIIMCYKHISRFRADIYVLDLLCNRAVADWYLSDEIRIMKL